MACPLRHHLCAVTGGYEPCALAHPCGLVRTPSEAIWAILWGPQGGVLERLRGAHLLHLLLLGVFGYYYVKAVMQQGLDFKIELPMADMV